MSNVIEVIALTDAQGAKATDALRLGINGAQSNVVRIEQAIRQLIPDAVATQSYDRINEALEKADKGAVHKAVTRFLTSCAFGGCIMNAETGLIENTTAQGDVIEFGTGYTGQSYRALPRKAGEDTKPLVASEVSRVLRHARHGVKGQKLTDDQQERLAQLTGELNSFWLEVTGKDLSASIK